MDKVKIEEIRKRATEATPELLEEEPGWIISKSLSPAGCRVYSPHAGIVRNKDYQLFLHAREDILSLLACIESNFEELKPKLREFLSSANFAEKEAVIVQIRNHSAWEESYKPTEFEKKSKAVGEEIYIPCVEQGQIPDSQEFVELMRKYNLYYRDVEKDLHFFAAKAGFKTRLTL